MKAPKKASSSSPAKTSSGFTLSPIVWQAALALVVILGTFALFKMTSDEVRDMRTANDDQLKALFFGDRPQVVYCAKGGRDETLPAVVAAYKALVTHRVGVAMVNCSHVLPSGKTVWDRFKLMKDWKPTVFSFAPWAKPRQISPPHLKDATALKKHLDAALMPRGTDVTGEKDLAKHCGFGAATSSMETCLVLLKGSRYSKVHAEMEERFVRANPRARIAAVDASKLRLSFENVQDSPHDAFALRLHAIRNGTHYQTMTFPATLDYLLSFSAEALGSPIEAYTSAKGGIKLLKVSASAFKDRSAQRAPPSSSDDDASSRKEKRKANKDDTRGKSSDKDTSRGGEERSKAHEKAREGIHEAGHSHAVEVDEDAELIEL